ncbi:D-fructose 1,6-bisphosphatase [Cnuella takakiae]|uniref:Fructose-1,6-bisphosphatase class 1 n=1 Tax=Cnuella takakiae TaxID=1302690 RepID=A0A1M5DWP8_9BACT|nr:class 1 fructose-bisphosphatase [Cnuella takakiae]OLY93843.1 fructose-bisphosphatase [Cnuella takakiae]SHF71284.1 D-fructose 1,6-bisphosphatase [Cnuella takakiae]
MTNKSFMTLDEFTIQQLRLFPGGTGELSRLLRDIGLASKRINVEVNKAGLQDIIGNFGTTNIQGEEVKKLDMLANNQLRNVLRSGMSCAGVCSEEENEIIVFDDELSNNSKYVVLFDPLDGSSNIDTNITIGTIFSIFKRVTPLGTPCTIADFLQEGHKQVAAGYVIYGSSTMLVYATRLGVNGFTLDPSIGEFCLSHPEIACPSEGNTYSVNESNYACFPEGVRAYLDSLKEGNRKKEGTYSLRYAGSMVADLHRNLIKGGIFLYPGTTEKASGKLRLMYECNPFAYIYKMAGGKANDGKQDILNIVPLDIHERSPLFVGSKEMMEDLETFLA